MAEFCKKCADEHGFPEAELTIKALDIKPGSYMNGLCEGCGTQIFIMNYQGEEVIFRPDKPVVM